MGFGVRGSVPEERESETESLGCYIYIYKKEYTVKKSFPMRDAGKESLHPWSNLYQFRGH